jgi:ribulose kinase
MSEHTTEEQQGCDVCGTVLTAPNGYLRLEAGDTVFGQVCSWLCAIQFCGLKAAEQRTSLLSQIEELRKTNKNIEFDSYLVDLYRAGLLGHHR